MKLQGGQQTDLVESAELEEGADVRDEFGHGLGAPLLDRVVEQFENEASLLLHVRHHVAAKTETTRKHEDTRHQRPKTDLTSTRASNRKIFSPSVIAF
jgi:hypothetical protein